MASLLESFQNHLSQRFSELAEKKILVALSGGLDSMVLTELLYQSGYNISLAHCNFGLRGNESQADEHFVLQYASSKKLPVFVQRFDTDQFAKDAGLSVQVAARELRYRWFEEIRQSHQLDFVVTAHQADDNLETFFINFSRGTGIEGLTGIPEKTKHIRRPLLVFSRQQLEQFASLKQIPWREDSSNASDKYLRNRIRHHLVPELKALQPQLNETFARTLSYLQQTQAMAEDASIMIYQRVAQQEEEQIVFKLDELLKLPNYESYLYHWLREFGFTAWPDVFRLVQSETGRQVHSASHTLLKDRNRLLLFPTMPSTDSSIHWINDGEKDVNFPVKLSMTSVSAIGKTTNTTIFANADLLEFPLELRRWRAGDVFCPLGMGLSSKKLSKFLKDEKVPLHQKENVWLLLSGGKVVWVIGMRQDERFRIQPTTTNILRISTTE